MSQIRGQDTQPELFVRHVLWSNGIRYRLYRKDLPGKPDIVINKMKTVIFIQGCFWHRHEGCRKSTSPKSNKKFWKDKFQQNVARDKKNTATLLALGWKVIWLWECALNTKSDRICLWNILKKSLLSKERFIEIPDPFRNKTAL